MPQSIRILSFVVVVLLTLAAAAGAQVCSDPANLTTNCGFDTDVTGWTLDVGTGMVFDPSGNQGPGSALIEAAFLMGYETRVSQCVGSVAASTDYGFGAVVQEAQAGTTEGCSVNVQEYSDGVCTTYVVGGDFAATSSFAGWTDMTSTTFTTTATTQSVLLTVSCHSMSGPFSVLVDDIYFGPGLLVPVELSSLNVE